MTKYLLLLTILLQVSFSQAQSFSISPNPVYSSIDLDANPFAIEVIAESIITNSTSETLNLKWERIVNDKPECWQTYVSDPWLSSIPSSNSNEFEINSNTDNNTLNVSAFVNNLTGMEAYAGEAHIVLKVSDLNNPTDSILVDYFITATGQVTCVTTGISEKEKGALVIYPNPSSDFFQLSENLKVQRLLVYNVLGTPVLTTNAIPHHKYDISALPQGMYLLTLIDNNGESIKTVKLIKD